MTWRGTLTLVLLVAAVITGWSVWQQRAEPTATVTASTRPSYLLHDFEVVALDGEGKESMTLRAPKLAQNADDRTMSIQTPLFLLPDKDGQRWEVRSKTAWVAADNSEVRLRGDVVANSPPGAQKPSTLKTEQLNVFPDKNEATSQVLVSVTAPGSTMQGVGMWADLADKRIRLLSKVQMTDDPKRR
ncbi:LPS export ABC transporter periplasmic protein LptC [Luteimonas aquatica]|uniref:LPS export ABC transporter periplasmic protein LptC n=1 Tax=Luteimonas aquatica TaxID=450364 RepID=UPI001F570B60|nr:LPS export ABC transporter periplasmic protein LptC [Luteimonas aquatica]